MHHRRHRGRGPVGREAVRRARRRAGHRHRRRGLRGAVRPGRRPALPRAHRLEDLLRPGRQPRRRAADLARWPRDLGCDRARGGRCVDRLPPPRRPAAVLRRRRRARHRHRAGDRPAGQLVQPGALRRPDDAALGAGDLPPGRSGDGDHRPADRGRRGRHPDRDRAADVPLRAAVEPGRRRARRVGGPAVPPRARARLRRVRRRLHPRPVLHRADPHGSGDAGVRRHPDQRRGRGRRVPRRGGVPGPGAQAPRGAALHARERRCGRRPGPRHGRPGRPGPGRRPRRRPPPTTRPPTGTAGDRQPTDDRPADDAREPVPAEAPSGGGPDPAPDRTP